MKASIRNKRFTMGIVLFLVIILLLSILSAFYLNKLSKKTSAILKENHYSVVFANDMSKDLAVINQEIVNCLLTKENPDTLNISNKFKLFEESLKLEKNNITEIGEDKLVIEIETNFNDYRESIAYFIKFPKVVSNYFLLLKKYDKLNQQLMLLFQINEKAIEDKTNDAKVSAKKASLQMTFIGTICFLIAYAFTFIFAPYFNDRFLKLYDGIKEMDSSNYYQKLYLDGNDELYEISTIFNEMAEKLNENNKREIEQSSQIHLEKISEIREIKEILIRLKSIEIQANKLISKIEKDGLS